MTPILYTFTPHPAIKRDGEQFNNMARYLADTIRTDETLYAAFRKMHKNSLAVIDFAKNCLVDSTPNHSKEVDGNGKTEEFGTYSFDGAVLVASIRLCGIPQLANELTKGLSPSLSVATVAEVTRGVIDLRVNLSGNSKAVRPRLRLIRDILRKFGFGEIDLLPGDHDCFTTIAKRTLEI